jgi:purine nucleoside permease
MKAALWFTAGALASIAVALAFGTRYTVQLVATPQAELLVRCDRWTGRTWISGSDRADFFHEWRKLNEPPAAQDFLETGPNVRTNRPPTK